MPPCEICGSSIRGAPTAITIDGAVLRVCGACVKLGTPTLVSKPVAKSGVLPPVTKEQRMEEPAVELDREYHRIIKQAREKMELTQEELGRRINEKPSVIRLLESGKLKPDNVLARKVEHFLKVKLLVPVEET